MVHSQAVDVEVLIFEMVFVLPELLVFPLSLPGCHKNQTFFIILLCESESKESVQRNEQLCFLLDC